MRAFIATTLQFVTIIAVVLVYAAIPQEPTGKVHKYPVPNPPKPTKNGPSAPNTDLLTKEYAVALKKKMEAWRDLLDQHKAAQEIYYHDPTNAGAVSENLRLMNQIIEVSGSLQEDYLNVFGVIPNELRDALTATTKNMLDIKDKVQKALDAAKNKKDIRSSL